MRIVVTSVLVDDQDRALAFYTDTLGFRKKADIPMGESRWLPVVSPDDPDGVELLLEPSDHPAAGPFKEALVEDGIPFTSFGVDDVQAEFERLTELGVPLHAGAHGPGRGEGSGARRHVREPDPDRGAGGVGGSSE